MNINSITEIAWPNFLKVKKKKITKIYSRKNRPSDQPYI